MEDKKEGFDFCQDRDKLTEFFEQNFFEKLEAKKESLCLSQNKNIIQRDYSACAEERFNCFDIVRKLTKTEKKELFKPSNIDCIFLSCHVRVS